MSMRRFLPWAAAALIVAIVVHVAALLAVPPLIMRRVVSNIGAPNTMHLGSRPDAASRGIVRPSTDLLYALCPYDLSGGGVLGVTASLPQHTYWSVAGYDANTNNFFVRDDRGQMGPVNFGIIGPAAARPMPGISNLVASPTERGVVIIRILIDSDSHLAALQSAQRSAKCRVEL